VLGTDPSLFKGDGLPVDHVSWKEAEEFLRKLSEKEGRTYRFPTEAEWEYACRAGTTTPFALGGTISADQVNCDGTYVYGTGEEGVFREKTTPVASFGPNAWGLHDMHGNVHEWCQDWYDAWYYGKGPERDPPGGPQSSDWSAKILRGGSWEDPPWVCRSAARHRDYPGYGDDFYGLRPVVDVQGAP
jgi:formylglycine-generating enzyme required for sulfatase activity